MLPSTRWERQCGCMALHKAGISEHGGPHGPASGIDEILAADAWARIRARELTTTTKAAR